jgi:hypothetical protein
VLYPNSEIEPRSAINPANALNIVGEYQQDRWSDGGARGLVASVSHDGGSTWKRVVVPGVTRCSGGTYDRASDPWVSFASNGDLYAISLSFDVFDTRNAVIVSKSTDGGDTWGPPKEITADNTDGLDKESITVDPGNPNVIYAAWDRLLSPGGSLHASDQGFFNARSFKSQTFFAKSTNGGQSWSTPQQIYTDSSFSGSIGSMIRVLPDGTLLDCALAERRQYVRDVLHERAVRPDDEHASTRHRVAVAVEQERRSVQPDRRLAGARAALDDERRRRIGGDQPVLVGLNRRDDVAHVLLAAALELLEQEVADSGAVDDRAVERLVGDVDEVTAVGAKPPA